MFTIQPMDFRLAPGPVPPAAVFKVVGQREPGGVRFVVERAVLAEKMNGDGPGYGGLVAVRELDEFAFQRFRSPDREGQLLASNKVAEESRRNDGLANPLPPVAAILQTRHAGLLERRWHD